MLIWNDFFLDAATSQKERETFLVVGTSVMIENFLMTVLLERNFPIFAN